MTVENASGAPAGEGIVAPAAEVKPAPEAPASTTATQGQGDQAWLNERIAQAKKSAAAQVLKDLGVPSIEEARKAVADAKAKADAEKTAEAKALELTSKLAATENEKGELATAVAAIAASQLSALTAEQKSAVIAVAGENPAKQIQALAALAPTWASSKAATEDAAAKPAAKTAPDTAPHANAPTGKTPPATDHKAAYAELVKINPIAAARYAFANGVFGDK